MRKSCLEIVREQAKIGNVEVILFLLEHGADIAAKDKKGCTPLINATTFHHRHAVDVLVNNGASTTICNACNSLHSACVNRHLDCIRGMLDRGQNVNLYNYEDFNYKGKTPLMLCCELGHVDCVEFLLQRGAKVNIRSRNKLKNTALIIAAEHGHLACIECLLRHNVNINDVDNNKQTALIHACKRNHITIVKALLDNRGADPLVTDKYDKDAFRWSSILRFDVCLNLLKAELDRFDYKRKHAEKMHHAFAEVNKMGCDKIQQEKEMYEQIHLRRKGSHELILVEKLAKDTAALCMSICTPNHGEGAAGAGYEEFYLKLPSLKASPVSLSFSLSDAIIKNKRSIDMSEVKEKSRRLVRQMHKKSPSPPRLR